MAKNNDKMIMQEAVSLLYGAVGCEIVVRLRQSIEFALVHCKEDTDYREALESMIAWQDNFCHFNKGYQSRIREAAVVVREWLKKRDA